MPDLSKSREVERNRSRGRLRHALAMLLATSLGLHAASAPASRIVLRDGRILQGKYAEVGGTINDPQHPNEGRTVILLDDGLRQVFIPKRQVQEVIELDAGEPPESFIIPQQVCLGGSQVASVGVITRLTPFDEFGRRMLDMNTTRGVESFFQGITEVTPEYTKIECIDTPRFRLTWDMRLATSTIPRDVLARVLAKQVDPKNLDQRLKIVRLYIQAERFKDAEQELEAIVGDFPDKKGQFQPTVVRLHQAHARRILEEVEKRRASGQHALCRGMLEHFPSANVAGETLQAVRLMQGDYENIEKQGTAALARFDALVNELNDSALKARLGPIRDEIKAELGVNTLDRFSAFMQFMNEPTMPADANVALAVSGWLLGGDQAVRNLPTALSLVDCRNLFRQYFAEPLRSERDRILGELKRQEAYTPELAAQLIAVMKPPVDPPKVDAKPYGSFTILIDYYPNEQPIEYLVQLPREYDPHRRYPAILTLHAQGGSAEGQIDWWAGAVGPDGNRGGHADRNGYIVLAPKWAQEQQQSYYYSREEHFAVLRTLRDACRRLSIDTDRVFLSGHSMGGDAAWDIGLAHPDLWAGIVAVSAQADKTVNFYWQNAPYVPLYLVMGQMDGERWVENADQVDRYLTTGQDTTVVRFLGRGHEHFSDEQIRLFDWMNRRRRDFFPRKFLCRSVREFDNFFWWAEVYDPLPNAMVNPNNWPPKNLTTLTVEGGVNLKNGLFLNTGARAATVWLSPEIIDFKQPTEIRIRNQRANKERFVEPDAAVMLEDARTRADRKHPFWAKISTK